uniref:Uncharacterized protein n=1 Tax=Arundo donax TaxID=35708 RepID=A0A0A8Z5J1_ARUDO
MLMCYVSCVRMRRYSDNQTVEIFSRFF